MYLCIDLGNSHLSAGVFEDGAVCLQFRYDSKRIGTSDELGIFLRNVLKENNINYAQIKQIGIASVVPSADYTVGSACIKYLNVEPVFLKSTSKTGITIDTRRVSEVGADLIAGVMAAKKIYPDDNVLVFDFGTATTCSYINSKAEMLGVSIAPGIRLMMESLQNNTARLFGVNIAKPKYAMGKDTKMAIQSGIYYAQIGLIEKLIIQTKEEYELSAMPKIIGTGGYSKIFKEQKLFDKIVPELVLEGIKMMLDLNQVSK